MGLDRSYFDQPGQDMPFAGFLLYGSGELAIMLCMDTDIAYHIGRLGKGWRWWLTDVSGNAIDIGYADTMALARAAAFRAAILRSKNK